MILSRRRDNSTFMRPSRRDPPTNTEFMNCSLYEWRQENTHELRPHSIARGSQRLLWLLNDKDHRPAELPSLSIETDRPQRHRPAVRVVPPDLVYPSTPAFLASFLLHRVQSACFVFSRAVVR